MFPFGTHPDTYNYELGHLVSSGYQVFDDSWDTYIKEHKQELIKKIIRRYYFNEICCNQPDRFRHYINEHLARIMPYYNQLYASELIKISPLMNHMITTNGRSIENVMRNSDISDSEVKQVISDFAKSGKNIGNVTDGEKRGRDETETYTRDYTETKNKTEDEGTDVDRNLTGTYTRTGDTTSTVDGTTKTTSDGTKKYSDTPQKTLTGAIDETYLTNYTHDNQTANETRHDETSTKISQTDNTTENETTGTQRDLIGKEDTKGNIDDTRNKNITDNINKTTDTVGNTFEHGSDGRNEGRARSENEVEKKQSDKGESSVMSGFMNVSSSQLLMAFRETFLNIDNMIISELAENFMEVY